MDVAANEHLGAGAQIKFNTGKGAKRRTIDIMEQVRRACRTRESQGLLRLHYFSGAVWVVSSLAYQRELGWTPTSLLMMTIQSSTHSFVLEKVLYHPLILSMESFPQKSEVWRSLCVRFTLQSACHTKSLISAGNSSDPNTWKGKCCPHATWATLLPHVMRTNYICARDKTYTTATPALPRLEDNGWSNEEGVCSPDCLIRLLMQSLNLSSVIVRAHVKGTVHVQRTVLCARRCASATHEDVAIVVTTVWTHQEEGDDDEGDWIGFYIPFWHVNGYISMLF